MGKSHVPRRHTWRKFSKFYWPLSGVGIPMEQPACYYITPHWHLIERTPGPYYLTALNALCYFPGPPTMLTMLAVPLKLPTPDSGILDLENFAQV